MARRTLSRDRFGVVVSRFNEFVTRRLLEGCLEAFASHRIPRRAIDVVWVPGAFEIPVACQALLRKRRYAALVALGAVIRGETPHFEYVASAATEGVSRVTLDHHVPIAFGILTADSTPQALARAGKRVNRGREAAETALQMACLFRELSRR